MAKPIPFTIVNAVPRVEGLADLATSVENMGESAITTSPQKSRNIRNKISDPKLNAKGDARHQQADSSKAVNAVLRGPACCEIYPAIMQAREPVPITKNDQSGTLIVISGCS